jgi:hypothetical protein
MVANQRAVAGAGDALALMELAVTVVNRVALVAQQVAALALAQVA